MEKNSTIQTINEKKIQCMIKKYTTYENKRNLVIAIHHIIK